MVAHLAGLPLQDDMRLVAVAVQRRDEIERRDMAAAKRRIARKGKQDANG
jgi:hypothetical protein